MQPSTDADRKGGCAWKIPGGGERGDIKGWRDGKRGGEKNLPRGAIVERSFVVSGFLVPSYNCGIINPQEKWLH